MNLIFILSALSLVVAFYVLARCEWLYRRRIALIDRDLSAYLAAPTFHQMMYVHFWDWNFDRLCKRSRT